MSALSRLRKPLSPPNTGSISPTSSPFTLPPDRTVTSTLPFLKFINSIPGTHHIAGFLLAAFAAYLPLRQYIVTTCNVRDSDRLRLEELKDMIALAKTILGIPGIPGHEWVRFCVVDKDPDQGDVRSCWSIVVPMYRLLENENVGQRPTLNLGAIKLVWRRGTRQPKRRPSDALATAEYEWMLQILISKIIQIIGSDCVPVVMEPVLTEGLKEYIEPLTRMGKRDAIEFPAVEGREKPRFRLLGLSNEEIKRRGWVRMGTSGWNHIQEEPE